VNLYLVYQLEIDSGPAPVVLWKERAADFTPVPVGCFFAEDEGAACEQAARHHGHAGVYAAVQAHYRKLDFGAAPFEDVERLKKKAWKQKKEAAKR
jgi:hypothetical protein